MKEYEELINQVQSGEIDMLEFVLEQEALANAYVEEMRSKGITPTPENAEKWLSEYENNYLYN